VAALVDSDFIHRYIKHVLQVVFREDLVKIGVIFKEVFHLHPISVFSINLLLVLLTEDVQGDLLFERAEERWQFLSLHLKEPQ
jgi:hypothetical protein